MAARCPGHAVDSGPVGARALRRCRERAPLPRLRAALGSVAGDGATVVRAAGMTLAPWGARALGPEAPPPLRASRARSRRCCQAPPGTMPAKCASPRMTAGSCVAVARGRAPPRCCSLMGGRRFAGIGEAVPGKRSASAPGAAIAPRSTGLRCERSAGSWRTDRGPRTRRWRRGPRAAVATYPSGKPSQTVTRRSPRPPPSTPPRANWRAGPSLSITGPAASSALCPRLGGPASISRARARSSSGTGCPG